MLRTRELFGGKGKRGETGVKFTSSLKHNDRFLRYSEICCKKIIHRYSVLV